MLYVRSEQTVKNFYYYTVVTNRLIIFHNMFCKKCGTEQKEGQKFCPKCGEPFLDEKGKPYLKGIKKELQDAKDKMASKVDELSQQGIKIVEEKVQPQFHEKIEELRKTDWKGKRGKVLSFVNSLYRRFTNAGIKTKVMMVTFVVFLFFILFGKFACSDSGASLFQGESPQEEFIGLLDNPSTAFTVRIDKILGRNQFGVGMVEVPEGKGSKDGSNIWTLIFFPENESKTTGRAILEAWLIDRDAWANAYTKTYRYEVRDGIVELYNGYNRPNLFNGWSRCSDMRLYIEKEDGIILRGEFANKERQFKQSHYKAASDKKNHYLAH